MIFILGENDLYGRASIFLTDNIYEAIMILYDTLYDNQTHFFPFLFEA